MSSLTPKTYVLALTAEEIEKRLLAVDTLVSKDIIVQSLSSPTSDTVPSSQAVVDALSPINSTLNGLGALASKDSISLNSNETIGTLPISKGGTGGTNVPEAQQNLGILSESKIQDLINKSIPTIQQVALDSAQVSGVLPVAKGGTGSSNPAQALKNLGIHDSTGKVPVSQLPAVALTDTFPVSSEAQMLGLTAEAGDVAIRTDINKTFILMQSPASLLSNWKELLNDAEVKLTPQLREAIRRSYAEIGVTIVPGSFEEGGQLNQSNEAIISISDGQARSWTGSFPKVVTPGTSPTTSGFSNVSATSLRGTLLSPSGSENVVHKTKTVAQKLNELDDDIIVYSPVAGVLDDTPFVNDILNNHVGIYFSAGVYSIDPDVGIRVKSGSVIDGAGFMRVCLVAKQTGATVSELASYTKGSMLKRNFTVGVVNPYVSDVRINNISIILRHPTVVSSSNYVQIGIDLRNCDRAWVGSGVYVGNTTLDGMPYTWVPNRSTQAQGYGIVLGTRNSNSVDYCGGVGCILENVKVYGARKNIVVDDLQLTPDSAAHATIVRSPDIQIGVELISASGRYNAGTIFSDCLLQSLQRFNPTDVTVGMNLSGYNCKGEIRYLEGGPNCDIIASCSSTSSDCTVDVLYASVTGPSAGSLTDTGVNNVFSYRELTAVTGGKTTKGKLINTFNASYVRRKIISTFINTLGPQTVVGDSGVTVTRTGAGAYTLTVDKPFSGNLGVNISAKTNSSRQGFSFAYSARTNSSIHIDTYVNNSLLDPEEMTIEIFQV
ncbi:putative tail fiber protein [Aeromonas phage phiA8-29]|uniref:Putative tail fiber protein n=1 Tax=Aeromonas phage phiA8-29 TaxID=1978922 RepID=A0A1W6DXS8_9CAUD|nr:minor tail protein [Aeromonas phage phiA8-29]ARK07820.1 putative tail fiber protein [Aeromonas phage phiA8-29]